MAALNIGGMEMQITRNEEVGAAGGSTYTENLVKDSTDVEPYVNCTHPDVMEDEVILGARIAVKVG